MSVPEDIHARLRTLAKEHDTTIVGLLRQLVAEPEAPEPDTLDYHRAGLAAAD